MITFLSTGFVGVLLNSQVPILILLQLGNYLFDFHSDQIVIKSEYKNVCVPNLSYCQYVIDLNLCAFNDSNALT